MGCTQECEMYPGWFSGLENTHNKERYNLEWFLSVFLDVQCPAYCNPVLFFLLCENNVQRKQDFLERQFFAPTTATMIYYEDCMTLPGWFEHNSLLILSRTYLHDVSCLRPRQHVLGDAGTRIYIYHEIELDSSTGLSVGALFRTRRNNSIIWQKVLCVTSPLGTLQCCPIQQLEYSFLSHALDFFLCNLLTFSFHFCFACSLVCLALHPEWCSKTFWADMLATDLHRSHAIVNL